MTEQPIRFTAAICTHNRAALLPAAIESLLAQSLALTDFEILVIDNASTDGTSQIIRRYLTAGGNVTLRSAVQPILGLSHARNLAVEIAGGDIIAFMDDDAVANPDWLAAMLDAYTIYPDAWVVGGKVLPLWQGERPIWLTDDLLPQLSMLDFGDDVRPLNPGEQLYGVNFSCRRCAFARIGLFRSDLGRQGVNLLGSEESDLQRRILQQGQPIIYTPHAIVEHHVTKERMQTQYFFRLAFAKGRTSARLMMTDSLQQKRVTRHIVRRGCGVIWRWLKLGLYPFDKSRRLQCMRVAAHWIGFTLEVLRRGSRQFG
ncbi:MAG: glycosyltransferase family 2 protein [Caldilineaceae bacterium]|nr:glycosyltransferase family 2 protein [Caldilineaceae bacterium]